MTHVSTGKGQLDITRLDTDGRSVKGGLWRTGHRCIWQQQTGLVTALLCYYKLPACCLILYSRPLELKLSDGNSYIRLERVVLKSYERRLRYSAHSSIGDQTPPQHKQWWQWRRPDARSNTTKAPAPVVPAAAAATVESREVRLVGPRETYTWAMWTAGFCGVAQSELPSCQRADLSIQSAARWSCAFFAGLRTVSFLSVFSFYFLHYELLCGQYFTIFCRSLIISYADIALF